MTKRIWHRQDDKAVAAVIGALLLAAMGVTFFASFTLWYVPTVTQANEQTALNSQSAALVELSQQLQTNLYPGKIVTLSFPLGSAGAPPFTQSSQSQLSFELNSSKFSGSLNYSFTVTLQNTTGFTAGTSYNMSYNGSFTFAGIYEADLTPVSGITQTFYLMDGTALQSSSGSTYILNGLPIGESNITGSSGSNLSLSFSAFSFTGQQLTTAGYGSSIVSMQSVLSDTMHYMVGQNLTLLDSSLSPYSAVVTNVTLSGFNYTIKGTVANAFEKSIYAQYGGGTVSGGKWVFHDFPLNATVSGSNSGYSFHVYLRGNNSVQLNSLSIMIAQFNMINL